jgi:hypothetical protein
MYVEVHSETLKLIGFHAFSLFVIVGATHRTVVVWQKVEENTVALCLLRYP